MSVVVTSALSRRTRLLLIYQANIRQLVIQHMQGTFEILLH